MSPFRTLPLRSSTDTSTRTRNNIIDYMDRGGVGWLLRTTNDGALALSWTLTICICWASRHKPACTMTGLGLCKMFVLFEAFVEKNKYHYSQTPPLFGHPVSPLHRPHNCAIQCFPSTILYCNICHTIYL